MSDSREVPMTAVVTAGTGDPSGLDRDPFTGGPSGVDSDPGTNAGSPAVGTTESPELAGDDADDDAAYIDAILSPGRDPLAVLLDNDVDSAMGVAQEPDPRDAVTSAIPSLPVPLQVNYPPVMILPPDPLRKRFVMWASGDFKWSGDANTCSMSADYPGAAIVLDLPQHTGAVWVAPASTASGTTVTVQAISITGGC